MALRNGQLLLNRRRLTLSVGTTDVDTGLTQVNKGMDPDPGLNIGGLAPPSRVQVCPLAPLADWANVQHTEPYFDSATGTVHVEFTVFSEEAAINVLFWDPHTMLCPISCDPYPDVVPPEDCDCAEPIVTQNAGSVNTAGA